MKLKNSELEKTAWECYQQLQTDIVSSRFLFLRIGEILKKIRDEKLYLYLGDGGFGSFPDFLNNPEIGIKTSTAYLYIIIYEEFKLRLEMKDEEIVNIPINRLQALRPLIKNMGVEEARNKVNSIIELTNYDYQAQMQEMGLREIEKPQLYKDVKTGKWIIDINPECTLRIYDLKNKVIIYGEKNE